MNYSTSVSLTPEDNDRYQAVYAGQRYGTFHGIFAKFKIKKKGNKSYLHGLDLELLNYKGILNIQLEKGSKIDTKAKERKRNVSVILVKVTVRAKIGKINTKDTITIEEPFELKKNTFFSVVCDLLPLTGIPDEKSPFVNGLFDEEFFYRDGLVNEERVIVNIPLEKDTKGGDDKLGFDFDSDLLPDDRFSSIRCRVGNSKIIT